MTSVLRCAHSLLRLTCALIVALSTNLASAAPRRESGSSDPEPTRLHLPVVARNTANGVVARNNFGYMLFDNASTGLALDPIDISGTGTEIAADLWDTFGGDEYGREVGPIPLDMFFPAYDSVFNSVYIYDAGNLRFGRISEALTIWGLGPATDFANHSNYVPGVSHVYYQRLTNPVRFVVEYRAIRKCCSGGTVDMQIILYPSGDVRIQHLRVDPFKAEFAKIGINGVFHSDPLVYPRLAESGGVVLFNYPDSPNHTYLPDALRWRSYGLSPQRLDSILFGPGAGASQMLFVGGEDVLLRSADGGKEWTRVGPSGGPTVHSPNWQTRTYALSPDPAEAGVVYAGGLVLGRSANYGNSWAEQLSAGGNITDLAYSPSYVTDRTLVAVGKQGASISRDSGRTWQLTAPAGPDASLYRVHFSPRYSIDGTIWASKWSGELYKSTDHGASWTEVVLPQWDTDATERARVEDLAPTATGPDATSIYLLARRPNDSFAQLRIYRSDDDGATWRYLYKATYRAKLLRVDPNDPTGRTIYLGSPWDSAPVSRSLDGGVTWENFSEGFASSFIEDLAVKPGSAEVFALTYDRQSRLLKRAPGEASWQVVARSSPDLSAFQPSAQMKANGATQLIANSYRSEDGGRTWIALDNLPDGEKALQAVEASPVYAQDGIAFALAAQHLLRTMDGGVTWQTLRMCNVEEWLEARAIAFSPAFATDRTVFIMCGLELLRTKDAGASWQTLGLTGPSTIAVSPNFAQDRHVYAVGGWASYPAQFSLSVDGGNTWDTQESWKWSAPLRISPAYATDRTLYLTRGLWRSTDYGATWTKIAVPVEGATEGLELSPHEATRGSIFYANSLAWEGFAWGSSDGGATWRNLSSGLPYPVLRGRLVYRYEPHSDRLYAFSPEGLWWRPMEWKTGF